MQLMLSCNFSDLDQMEVDLIEEKVTVQEHRCQRASHWSCEMIPVKYKLLFTRQLELITRMQEDLII